MAAMGAGHLIALADAGIERSQACFGGHGAYVAGKQQDYTKYRCSHCWSAWSAPPANANGTTQVSGMEREHGSHSARNRAERICEETFARGWTQFLEADPKHQVARNAANTVAQNAAMVIPALAA